MHRTPMIDSFFLHTFWFPVFVVLCIDLNIVLPYIHNEVYVVYKTFVCIYLGVDYRQATKIS